MPKSPKENQGLSGGIKGNQGIGDGEIVSSK